MSEDLSSDILHAIKIGREKNGMKRTVLSDECR